MFTQVKLRPVYFVAIFILLCACLLLSLSVPKSYSFRFFNPYHNSWLNNFFISYTFAGDGLLSVFALVVLFILRKNKEAFVLMIAFLSSGLASAALKNLFNSPRPKLFFEHLHLTYPNFIEGITLANNSSFPSGHTASAFAMATLIVLLSNKKVAALIATIAAILVGYSRIYLGQHFLPDVIAGAFLGIICAMSSYYLIYQKQLNPFHNWKRNSYSKTNNAQPQWN